VTDAMPLPPAMVERARAFQGPPAPTRAAATVVLLRPSGETFQVYVLKRATTMVFGGVYAFPGGRVDPSDRPETLRDDWAARLGVGDEQARAVVGAAARELFEEAGVLLAGPHDEADRTVSDGSLSGVVTLGGPDAAAAAEQDDDEVSEARRALISDDGEVGAAERALSSDDQARLASLNGVDDDAAGLEAGAVVGDVSEADWEADRAAVAARELTMTELLERRGLRLRDDLLLPWARWITPEFEPKRFDTWFFVALLPESQTARDVSGEADHAQWIEFAEHEGLSMLPPTRAMMRGLSAYGKVAEVVAAASRRDAAAPVMPRVIFTEDGGARVLIEDPGAESEKA
jgi:8-oxo-dGTP pyrophosphatase MutT (NUDIX family)